MYKFKDYQAFEKFNDEVCYIPELTDNKYSGNDFLEMSNNDIEIAKMVFSLCDWQHPGTVLDELCNHDDTFPFVGRTVTGKLIREGKITTNPNHVNYLEIELGTKVRVSNNDNGFYGEEATVIAYHKSEKYLPFDSYILLSENHKVRSTWFLENELEVI